MLTIFPKSTIMDVWSVLIVVWSALIGIGRTICPGLYSFFSIWVFFNDHSGITGLQGKGDSISLTPHYHFHPLQRHLDISRAITAEISPLHTGNSRTWTGNLWFSSANDCNWTVITACICLLEINSKILIKF